MAEPEKAVIDCLLFSLPLEEINSALENEELDFEKLAVYAARTGNVSLIKRLGYLLESKKGNSYGLNALDYNYVPLDPLGKKKGKKDRKWRLLINTQL
jgi:predicted transcriptional regulator of viral defense system